VVLVMIYKRGE